MFNCNIFKINKNKLLLINKYKLNTILQIFQNNTKEFSIKKEKFQIFIEKIDKYIKKYYNKLLQKYLRVTNFFLAFTLALLVLTNKTSCQDIY